MPIRRRFKDTPAILRAKSWAVYESPFTDEPQLDPKDTGSMVIEHTGVPRGVAVESLRELGELSLLEPDNPERSARLIAIANAMYPETGDLM